MAFATSSPPDGWTEPTKPRHEPQGIEIISNALRASAYTLGVKQFQFEIPTDNGRGRAWFLLDDGRKIWVEAWDDEA